jgi:hypothetical protein
MGRAEVLDRIRQEVQKRGDAVLSGLGIDPLRVKTRRAEVGIRRFFFGKDNLAEQLDLLRERMPQHATSILAQAEKICLHRFDLLGYKDLRYGQEIDWHLDRVNGKHAPLDLWFKVPYLNFDVVGDSKVTWELNRHQHLVTLAKAYRLSNDQRFASELIAQWSHWQQENPYPRGINWASSLEVAFRSLSWIWVHFLLEDTPVFTKEFVENLRSSMARSGRHIELYHSTHFSPNTHLLGEAVALFFIGTLYPEIESAEHWRKWGWQTVLQESQRQVRPDGFYFEQSTFYHVYALDFFLHAGILASLNDMPFPGEYYSRIEKMLEVLALFCRAGSPPRLGDDDGGRLFDPRRNRSEHLSDPLCTGAALFHRGDFKHLSGGLQEETLWLLGKQGASEFDRIEETLPEMNSVALPDSGLYVMGSGEKKMQAVIDGGPQGALGAGHGHADALSLTLHVGGHELLIDSGTYQYVGSGMERAQFRGTAAHNTLQLDGRNQSEPAGPFAWEQLTNSKTEKWISGQTFDLFVGAHDGYSVPGNAFIHRRWVFSRKGKFWFVRDLMLGVGEHRLDLHWRLGPDLLESENTQGASCFSRKGEGVSLLFSSDRAWSKRLYKTMWSPAYGVMEEAGEIGLTTTTTLPAEVSTLITSGTIEGKNPHEPGDLSIILAGPELSVYRYIDGAEEHHFVFSAERAWSSDGWRSDAEFMHYYRQNGSLKSLIFCNATYLEAQGKQLVSSREQLRHCEIYLSQGRAQIATSDKNVTYARDEICRLFQVPDSVLQEISRVGH